MSTKKVEKKGSGKNSTSTWACPGEPQCKNWKTVPCKHLEVELKKEETHKSVGARPVMDIDKYTELRYSKLDTGSEAVDISQMDPSNFIITKDIAEGTYEKRFRAKLKKAGLTPLDADVIVFKFFYEMSLQEIADELGLSSLQTTHNILQKALKILKSKGFGVKK